MRGKIVVEVTRRAELPESLALPDMGHVAALLRKELPDLTWTSQDGKLWRLGDAWEVTAVTVDAR